MVHTLRGRGAVSGGMDRVFDCSWCRRRAFITFIGTLLTFTSSITMTSTSSDFSGGWRKN